jgi:nucleotide-binding universal stress UspA family protein
MAGNPFSIVVGVKLDDPDELALREALELATRTSRAHVHAVVVVEPIGDVLPRTHRGRDAAVALAVKTLQEKVSSRLDEMTLREHHPPPIERVQVHGEYGHVATSLVMLAELVEADAIVVGMRPRRGVKGLVVGTVAEHVLRHAGCTVLVARPKSTAEGPHVEPICPDCLTRRAESKGTELWCARHSEHHPRAHAYGYEAISSDSARPWGFSEPPRGAT